MLRAQRGTHRLSQLSSPRTWIRAPWCRQLVPHRRHRGVGRSARVMGTVSPPTPETVRSLLAVSCPETNNNGTRPGTR